MTYSEQLQHTVDRFIELYGDRKGKIGSSMSAGFGWLQNTKLILLARRENCVLQPADWYRSNRLIHLAQQLTRPLLLWNLSFQADEPPQNTQPLVIAHACQDSKRQLLKLPLPIISVFNESAQAVLEPEFVMADAAVLVGYQDKVNQFLFGLPRTKIVNSDRSIKAEVLDLLEQVSAIPGEVLVSERMARLQKIVEQRD